MSARVSLRRTKCDDDTDIPDYYEARRALRQHGNHSYRCVQFVNATAYLLGSADVA